MVEGLEVDGMAEVVALVVVGACDEEEVEVLVEFARPASSRNANFTGMESILSGTMVPSEGKEN